VTDAVTPEKAGVHASPHGLDSRSPTFAEDKLRGNDWYWVLFEAEKR
jgi:hypothetical protein